MRKIPLTNLFSVSHIVAIRYKAFGIQSVRKMLLHESAHFFIYIHNIHLIVLQASSSRRLHNQEDHRYGWNYGNYWWNINVAVSLVAELNAFSLHQLSDKSLI